MVEDEPRLAAFAPGHEADEAITSSRRRISWSATHMVETNAARARAREALKQSYLRLGKVQPVRETPPDPAKGE